MAHPGVSGGYNLAFAATRFAASTWPRGPETPAPCHNCMSHQELGLLWAIQPPETPEEPVNFLATKPVLHPAVLEQHANTLQSGPRLHVRVSADNHRTAFGTQRGGGATAGKAMRTWYHGPCTSAPGHDLLRNEGLRKIPRDHRRIMISKIIIRAFPVHNRASFETPR